MQHHQQQLLPHAQPCHQQQSEFQNAAAFRVFLEAWQPPQQQKTQLVCTLLCCSNSMRQLVHSSAANLHVRIASRTSMQTQAHAGSAGIAAADADSAPAGHAHTDPASHAAAAAAAARTALSNAMGSWLAQHLPLVQQLDVDVGHVDETIIASGLSCWQQHSSTASPAAQARTAQANAPPAAAATHAGPNAGSAWVLSTAAERPHSDAPAGTVMYNAADSSSFGGDHTALAAAVPPAAAAAAPNTTSGTASQQQSALASNTSDSVLVSTQLAHMSLGTPAAAPAAATAAAAQHGTSLLLTAVVQTGKSSGSLLLALPSSTQLTRLQLCFSPGAFRTDQLFAERPAPDPACVSNAQLWHMGTAALASLEGLNQLKLEVAMPGKLNLQDMDEETGPKTFREFEAFYLQTMPGFDHAASQRLGLLLPALPHMSQLTNLELSTGCLTPASCSLLPTSLQQLTADRLGAATQVPRLFGAAAGTDSGHQAEAEALCFSHLSAVTRLSLLPPTGIKPWGVLAQDVLPPNVQELVCPGDTGSLQPVLRLKQLKVLRVACSGDAIAELQQLTTLPQLQLVALHQTRCRDGVYCFNLAQLLAVHESGNRLVSSGQGFCSSWVGHDEFEGFAAAAAAISAKQVSFTFAREKIGTWLEPFSAAALGWVGKWEAAEAVDMQDLQEVNPLGRIFVLLPKVGQLPNLRSLGVFGNDITPSRLSGGEQARLIEQLCGLTSLQSLTVGFLLLGESARLLAGATHLADLDLLQCFETADARALLVEAFGARVRFSR